MILCPPGVRAIQFADTNKVPVAIYPIFCWWNSSSVFRNFND